MSVVRWVSSGKAREPRPVPAVAGPRRAPSRSRGEPEAAPVPWDLLRRALPAVGTRLLIRVVERRTFRLRGRGIRRVRVRSHTAVVEAHSRWGMLLRAPRYRLFVSLADLFDGSVRVVHPSDYAERIRAAREAFRVGAGLRAA